MPLVRIDLNADKPDAYRRELGEIVHTTLVETLNVPADDKFQVITAHNRGGMNLTSGYLGISYSADAVLIQITLNAGRSTELKQAFYRRLADNLHERLGLRREDVIINLVETAPENWSFGGGVAQYAKSGA